MEPDDAALITFTTGSSGKPKAAWRTHDFLFQQHSALMKELKPEPGDVNMTTLPVFVFSNLAAGLTTILPDFNPLKPNSLKPELILSDLQKANTLICSPDFLMRLVRHIDLTGFQNLSGLKEVFTGGAPVTPQMAAEIEKYFPQTTIAYGSTEAEPVSSISVKKLAAYNGSDCAGIPVGKLHPDIELRIIPVTDSPIKSTDKEWEQTALPLNEIGEIVVSGPHVLKRYYKNPEAQARQKFEAGGRLWHRTGDSGYITFDNELFLTGPAKHLFKQNGKWIGQFPLEVKLGSLLSLKEATVLNNGSITIIFAVKAEKVSKQKALAEIGQTEIPYDHVEFLEALPKDPRHHSKIEYGKLLSLKLTHRS